MFVLGKKLSQIVSIILQPMLMPLYSVALLFLYTNFYQIYHGQVTAFILPVALLSFIIPVAFIVILKNMKFIKDYNLSFQSDRTLPFFIFIVANISLIYFFYQARLPYWFLGLIATPGLIALFGMIVNFFWKISIHMLGIGGLIGGVFSICFNVGANPIGLFMILFILAGLLGVSRLYLKRNTASQVYVGFILGLVLGFFSVLIGLQLMIFLRS